MKLYSTNRKSPDVNFKEALLRGLAPDGGLYMPHEFPHFTDGFLESLRGEPYSEVAFALAKLWLPEMNADDLQKIIFDAYDYSVPIKEVKDNLYVMELFHGPTLSFKDFGARFMARMMSYYLKDDNRRMRILVATSGDTGSAVASAFHNIPNIDVIVLFPKGKVSLRQERQMTTLGGNITCLEVDGAFDDCQKLVKDAFVDPDLSYLNLGSANSINIGRLLPQSFYYVWSYLQIAEADEEIIFCTPSGNFGNITAGLFSWKMGLPVKKFIAAVNDNTVFPEYLNSGEFHARPSKECYSNAMDVGNPSNFSRLIEMFDGSYESIKKQVLSKSVNNRETLEEIKRIYSETGYVLDPHGAVGFKVAEDMTPKFGGIKIVVIETAHPAKFGETVKMAIGEEPEMPNELSKLFGMEEYKKSMSKDYEEFKGFLMNQGGSIDS